MPQWNRITSHHSNKLGKILNKHNLKSKIRIEPIRQINQTKAQIKSVMDKDKDSNKVLIEVPQIPFRTKG